MVELVELDDELLDDELLELLDDELLEELEELEDGGMIGSRPRALARKLAI